MKQVELSLEQMKDVIDFPFEKIVYVLTDFTESNILFWEILVMQIQSISSTTQ